VEFLNCFEAEHESNIDLADGCAEDAGFEVEKLRACFDDQSAADSAIQMVLDRASDVLPGVTCFPWVSVQGKLISNDPEGDCLGQSAGAYPLVDTLCRSIEDHGKPLPETCNVSVLDQRLADLEGCAI